LVVTALAFVGLAQAEVDWANIKPIYRHVNPIRPAPTPKIVGGQEAEPHSIPFQVTVLLGGGFCGGSLIRPDVVLTAAHCVYGRSLAEITAGAHYILEKEPTHQIVETKQIIIHNRYDDWFLRNDIALLILKSEMKLDDTVALVELNEESSSLEGEEATISGWGKPADSIESLSPVLRYTEENIISNKECGSYYDAVYVQPTNVCLNGSNGRGSCKGDSGGPLTIIRNGKPVQAGIVSFGSGLGCEAGYPSVYTRVSEYAGWIRDNLP